MRTRSFIAAALLALPAAAPAQDAAAPAGPSCYIEVSKLFGEPPAGIGELGAAVRALDAQLRPQVEAINAVKAQIARLEQRQERPAQNAQQAMFEDEDEAPRAAAPAAGDGTAQELNRLEADLKAKQDQLKLDYAAQQTALVGPVQARVTRGAQFFASNNSGCGEVKMARATELAALTAAGARDVTGAFVSWYLTDSAS